MVRLVRRLSFLALLLLLGVDVYLPQGHSFVPSIQLDGASSFGGTGFDSNCRCFVGLAASLTTTKANDVIVVVAQCAVWAASCNDRITSVSDSAGHAWALRAAYTPEMGRPIWEYYTIASSPLVSDQINATWSGSDWFTFVAFAVNGVNVQHPWDPRLPVEQAAGSNCGSPGPACNTFTFPILGAQDFVIVTAASSDVCRAASPFRQISPFSDGGGTGKTDYFLTNPRSSKNITFTCGGNVVTLLADALQSQSRPIFGLDGIGTSQSWRWTPQGVAESQLLTTTQQNDVIIVIGHGLVSAIIDSSGLNFTQRVAYSGIDGSASVFEYYAMATSPLILDNITVVSRYVETQVLAIHGANTMKIFDTDPTIPSNVSCAGLSPCSSSIQTSTIDIVIAATAIDDADACGPVLTTPSPGFTNMYFSGNFEVDYAITTVPQTTIMFDCYTDAVAIVMDAISFRGAFGT